MYNPNDPRLSPQTILDQQFNINQYSHASFSAMGSLQDDMTGTLRSLRDTIATSFQTLNLTLSSMNSTLRTMTNATSTSMSSSFGSNSFIPAQQVMAFTGSMSAPMVDALSNKSYFGLMTERRPYNISPWEWNTTVQDEMNFRAAGLMSGAGAIGTQMTAATLAGNWAQRAVRQAYPKFAGKFPLAGFGMAAGIGAQFVLDPVVEAFNERAEEHLRDMAGIQRMSTQFSNKQFSLNQAHTVASSINRFGINEAFNSSPFEARLGTDGYRNVLMQGLQQGMFQGTTPEQLVKQVEQAAHVVKFLTGILGSKDVNETMQAVANLKNMGVNAFQNSAFTNKLGASAFQYSSIMGVTGADLVNQSIQHASQVGSMFGMPGYMGIMPTMQSMALAHSLEKSRNLSAAELSVAGGYQQVGRNMATFYGATMASPHVGGVAMLAGLGAGGTFSRGAMMNSFQNGGYYGLLGAAAQNASDPRKMLAYMANRTNMMDSFTKQGGSMQDMVNMVLHGAMQNAPFATESVDSFAAYLMQLGPSVFGQNLDEATAKALAYGAMNPERQKAVDAQGQRNLNRGILNTAKKEFSWYSQPLKLWDQLGNIPNWIKHHTIGTTAETAANSIANLMTSTPESYYRGAPGTIDESLGYNLRKPAISYATTTRNIAYGTPDEDTMDYYNVSSRLQNNGYDYATGKKRFWSSDADEFRAADRMLRTMSNDKDHLNRVLNGEGLDGTYAYVKLRGMMERNVGLFDRSEKDILRNYRVGRYNTYGGQQELAGAVSESYLTSRENELYGKFNKFSELSALLHQEGIDVSGYKDAAALYDRVLNNSTLKDEDLKRIGLQNRHQAAGLAVSSAGMDVTTLSRMQRVKAALPDNLRKELEITGDTLQREQGDTMYYSQFQGALNYTSDRNLTALSQFAAIGGIGVDDLRYLNSESAIRRYSELVGKLAVGEDLKEEDFKSLPKELSMKLQQLGQGDRSALRKMISDSKGIADRDKWGWGDLKVGGYDKFVKDFQETILGMHQGKMSEMLQGAKDVFGFDASQLDAFQKSFASGNYKDIEEFLKTNTKSRSWQTVQQSMANFSSMWSGESSITRENADVLAKQLGLKDAAELQGKGYNKDQIMKQLFMNTINGVKVDEGKEKSAEDTSKAMEKINQAFVPAMGGGYALKTVSSEINAAEQVKQTALGSNPPMPAQQPSSKPQWRDAGGIWG